MFRFTIRDVLWPTVAFCSLLPTVVHCVGDETGPTLKQLLSQYSAESIRDDVRAAHYEMMNYHRNAQWGVQRHLLVISWFKDASYVLRYRVEENGQSENVRFIFNHASQAGHREALNEDRLGKLKAILPMLPESKAEPPIKRTVHLSFLSGNKWRTETYDAVALPDEFEEVMKILGERFETEDRPKKK